MLELLSECKSEQYHFWVGVALQVSILILVAIGVALSSLANKKRK